MRTPIHIGYTRPIGFLKYKDKDKLKIVGRFSAYNEGQDYEQRLSVENNIGDFKIKYYGKLPSGSLLYADNKNKEVVLKWNYKGNEDSFAEGTVELYNYPEDNSDFSLGNNGYWYLGYGWSIENNKAVYKGNGKSTILSPTFDHNKDNINISSYFNLNNNTGSIVCIFYDENFNIIDIYNQEYTNNIYENKSVNFTKPNNTKYIRFGFTVDSNGEESYIDNIYSDAEYNPEQLSINEIKRPIHGAYSYKDPYKFTIELIDSMGRTYIKQYTITKDDNILYSFNYNSQIRQGDAIGITGSLVEIKSIKYVFAELDSIYMHKQAFMENNINNGNAVGITGEFIGLNMHKQAFMENNINNGNAISVTGELTELTLS